MLAITYFHRLEIAFKRRIRLAFANATENLRLNTLHIMAQETVFRVAEENFPLFRDRKLRAESSSKIPEVTVPCNAYL